MWDFLTNFFTDWTLSTVFARVGIVLLFTLVFYALFYYAKKSNMQTLIIFAVLAVLFVFALSFALPKTVVMFLAYTTYGIICLVGVSLFNQEFHRDLFRLSLKRSEDRDSGEDDYGRDDLNQSVSEIVKDGHGRAHNSSGRPVRHNFGERHQGKRGNIRRAFGNAVFPQNAPSRRSRSNNGQQGCVRRVLSAPYAGAQSPARIRNSSPRRNRRIRSVSEPDRNSSQRRNGYYFRRTRRQNQTLFGCRPVESHTGMRYEIGG